jgi:hypothetical protein
MFEVNCRLLSTTILTVEPLVRLFLGRQVKLKTLNLCKERSKRLRLVRT